MNRIDKLKKIFKENGVDFINDEHIDLLEIDSIQFVSIIVDIETEFDIEIPEEYLNGTKLKTFDDFVLLVEKLDDKN